MAILITASADISVYRSHTGICQPVHPSGRPTIAGFPVRGNQQASLQVVEDLIDPSPVAELESDCGQGATQAVAVLRFKVQEPHQRGREALEAGYRFQLFGLSGEFGLRLIQVPPPNPPSILRHRNGRVTPRLVELRRFSVAAYRRGVGSPLSAQRLQWPTASPYPHDRPEQSLPSGAVNRRRQPARSARRPGDRPLRRAQFSLLSACRLQSL